MDFELLYDDMDERACREILKYANVAAGLSTTRYGAVSVMPTEKEVDDFLNARR